MSLVRLLVIILLVFRSSKTATSKRMHNKALRCAFKRTIVAIWKTKNEMQLWYSTPAASFVHQVFQTCFTRILFKIQPIHTTSVFYRFMFSKAAQLRNHSGFQRLSNFPQLHIFKPLFSEVWSESCVSWEALQPTWSKLKLQQSLAKRTFTMTDC